MAEPGANRGESSVVVLGAGISGLSAAFALLLRGHAVTLIERGDIGRESSWAGGGILSPLLPWDYPEPLAALALRSMTAYAAWIGTIEAHAGVSTEFWQCGMRVFGLGHPDTARTWCRTHGLDARPEDGGLLLPDIAQVRNPRLVAALREAVVRLGGIIHAHCTAEAVETDGRRMTALLAAPGRFAADRFVIATGAWAGMALPGARGPSGTLAGVPQVRPIRGQMLLFKLAPGLLDTILYHNGLYLIPRRDGHVLVGSTLEDVGFDKSTDAATRQRLYAEAVELLPALAGQQPVRHWAGLRPGSPDNIPVIDRHPDFDNVFVNAGHYRYGVTLAPASSELLTALMDGTSPALDPAPYRWQAAQARSWTAPSPHAA